MFTALPPLALYIHIPWCVKKCPYCDFNSHAAGKSIPEKQYVAALLEDLQRDLPEVWGRRISSIFFGGGTPSLFSATAIDDILCGVRSLIPVLPNAEITLEANPGTFEQEKFNDFRALGINRLSIGIQSFNSDKLLALGRIHNGNEAITAVETAQRAGFKNFNLDLMFGLPQQSHQQGLNDLQIAIDLQPTHLSWYQLTIEPNTLFYSHPPTLPDDENIWQLQEQGQALLAQHGLEQYEISAYANTGKTCKHNMNYWEFGDYLGIGAGAHGKITRADNNSIQRLWKHRQPQAYMEASDKRAGTQLLTASDIIFEFMLNALRIKRGFELQTFESHTGLSPDLLQPALANAANKGLLLTTHEHIKPTELGYRFLNDLINLFSPE
jgi:putative oxygen-independent coproporphyrinogen III oxidase